MKSKELKNYNLPDNRMYNIDIEAKPINLFFILMIIGLLLAIGKYFVYGLSLFIFSLLCIFILPNRRMIEFYDDHMIIYNKARKDECNIIYYEDVKSWEYVTKLGVVADEIIFTLNDDTKQTLEAFNKNKFEKPLNIYLKDKKIVKDKKTLKEIINK